MATYSVSLSIQLPEDSMPGAEPAYIDGRGSCPLSPLPPVPWLHEVSTQTQPIPIVVTYLFIENLLPRWIDAYLKRIKSIEGFHMKFKAISLPTRSTLAWTKARSVHPLA